MIINGPQADRQVENSKLLGEPFNESKVCKTFIRRFDPDPRLHLESANLGITGKIALPCDSPKQSNKHRNARLGPTPSRTARQNGPTPKNDCEPRIYRRHIRGCRGNRSSCHCPIWLYHTTREGRIRRSLRTANWDRAREIAGLSFASSSGDVDECLAAKCVLAIAKHRQTSDARLVYFVAACRFIKIGIATDPEKRLRELQTASSSELILKLVVAGGRALERELHETLAAISKHGEWFRLTHTLAAVIKRSAQLARPQLSAAVNSPAATSGQPGVR